MSNYEFTDDGFVDDGYIFTGRPVIFQSGANRVELRGPSKRSGRVRLLQTEEYSSGWARYGYAPLAIVHTLTLEYQQLRSDEVDQLKAFQIAVDYSAGTFDYIDGASGLTVPAWFAEPNQAIEEISYNKYGATIELHSLSPFVVLPATPANIDAILNAAHYPCTVRITRKQPQVWMSDGTRRVSNKSAITRQLHTLALVRLTTDQLGVLIAHFVGMGGMRDRWTWTVAPAVLLLEGTTNICSVTSYNPLPAAWNQIASLAAGTVYTLSFKISSASGATILVADSGGQDIPYVPVIGTTTPTLYTRTFTSTAAQPLYLYTAGTDIQISELQTEAKDHRTPFVIGTRPDSYTPAVTHTCRHANTALDWQQSPIRSDRYDLTVSLEEDL